MTSPLRAAALLGAILATAALLPAPAPAASSRAVLNAGYDGDADGAGGGDAWVAASAGHTVPVTKGEGRLTASVDLSAGALAFASLDGLDRLFAGIRPEAWYLLSERVDAGLALTAEARLAGDDGRSALGWGATATLRERFSSRVEVAEHVAWSDLRAREERYSERTVAAGVALSVLLGERWSLDAGAEYAHGDAPRSSRAGGGAGAHRTVTAAGPGSGSGDGSGSGGGGAGTGAGMAAGDTAGGDDDTVALTIGATRDWSASVSSFAEYAATLGLDGGTGHAFTVGTSWRF